MFPSYPHQQKLCIEMYLPQSIVSKVVNQLSWLWGKPMHPFSCGRMCHAHKLDDITTIWDGRTTMDRDTYYIHWIPHSGWITITHIHPYIMCVVNIYIYYIIIYICNYIYNYIYIYYYILYIYIIILYIILYYIIYISDAFPIIRWYPMFVGMNPKTNQNNCITSHHHTSSHTYDVPWPWMAIAHIAPLQCGPPVISWLRKPIKTKAITIINHKP